MFKQQKIVITGGSSGLGEALAVRLAGEGAHLALIARNPQKLEQTAEKIRALHPQAWVLIYSADVTDEAATKAAMDQAAHALGGIDILVNNAGILREGYFEELPMQAFRDVMEINYFGILHATRAALPHLRKARGRLVNIASMAGLTGAFGYTPYCSAKHALMGLTDCLYYELEPQGIKVQLVCPGEFDSPLVDELETYRTPENRVHTLSIPKSSLDTIVEGTIAGIRADKHCIIPSAGARVMAFVLRHLPGLARVIARQKIRKVYRGPVVARPVPD